MSTFLIILGCLILMAIVVVQIGRVTELANQIRGEEEVQWETNRQNGVLSLVFLVVFLFLVFWSVGYFKNWMLGYGPHVAASAHGGLLDNLFDVTLFFTGLVFIITQIALFWFAYKYAGRKGGKSTFIPHDNKVEVIWTVVPAVVMCFLVIRGLIAWNEVMADIPEDAVAAVIPLDAGELNADGKEEYMEIEATGSQFLWYLRYPGKDAKLGARNYKLITGRNPLGQDWNDPKNLDDFQPTEIVLPVNKKVRVRITSRDVLHNFSLPHFRVKMDAVPGMPTYFVFTPTMTTEEYRQKLREYPEYQKPSDPNDPNSDPLWKVFDFELACQELCGSGHFSMRKPVRIVTEDEYIDWLAQQQSYYMTSIRGTEEDPLKDELLPSEREERKFEFDEAAEKALSATEAADKVFPLHYVTFEENSFELSKFAQAELDNLAAFLKKYPAVQVEIVTSAVDGGNPDANLTLADNRAKAIGDYLRGQGIDGGRFRSFSAAGEASQTQVRIVSQ